MIFVSEPKIGKDEIKEVLKSINDNWISGEGKIVSKFETKIANLTNRKYAVSVSNGSVALDLAIRSLKLKKGDEVICSTLSIISISAAIYRSGLKIVPVDCDMRTFNINVDQIEKNITKKTKAILVSHTYGLPCEMNKIIKIAKKYKLGILEDAAEMHGQYYNKKPCGSFGKISTLSFYANKHITTGEGGMILTNNYGIYKYCLNYKNLCMKKNQRFRHDDLGWNYRMSSILCALGLGQIKNLRKNLTHKINIGNHYNNLLKNNKYINLPIHKTDYATNNYWVYPIVINNNSNKTSKQLANFLVRKKIQTRPFFWPVHLQPVYLKKGMFKNKVLKNSEYLSKKGLYIPCGFTTSKSQVEYVCKMINNFFE